MPSARRRGLSAPSSTDIERGDVVGWSASGEGVVEVVGRRVLVAGVLPGEHVEVRPCPVPRAGSAELVRVITASPHRVEPDCPHAADCGGCSFQHVAYDEQVRLKRERVQALLDDALGARRVEVAPVVTTTPAGGVPRGFRDKAHFAVAGGDQRGALVVGHYRRGTQQVLPVTECPVHAPPAEAVLRAMHAALSRAGARGAGEDVERGGVRHLVVRASRTTGECLVTVVATTPDDPAVRRAGREVMEGRAAPVGLFVNTHDRPSSWLFGRETRRVAGRAHVVDEVEGTRFLVAPTAFFQTNVEAARAIVRLVTASVPAGARVLDLYAGAGLFALPLARAGHRVVAVEESRAAVASGEGSRALNRVSPGTCRFVCGRVEQQIQHLSREASGRTDVVVMDPPRQGCDRRVLDALVQRVRPARLIYVSCNPEALVRDLATLTEPRAATAYRVSSVVPVDMFPHTPHVEAVATLDRRTG